MGNTLISQMGGERTQSQEMSLDFSLLSGFAAAFACAWWSAFGVSQEGEIWGVRWRERICGNSIHNQGHIRDWQSSFLCEAFSGSVLFYAVESHPLIGEYLSHRIVLDSIAEHELHSLREVIHCCPYLIAEIQIVIAHCSSVQVGNECGTHQYCAWLMASVILNLPPPNS